MIDLTWYVCVSEMLLTRRFAAAAEALVVALKSFVAASILAWFALSVSAAFLIAAGITGWTR